MISIPTNNIISTSNDFAQAKARSAGRAVSVEISGVFGGASITPGYVSSDAVPVFITEGAVKTASTRWTMQSPASGKVAVRLTNASGTTAILVKIIEQLPR